MTEKKELRKRCIERMNALPQDYCREADEKIFSQILALPEYRSARTVFCFVGMRAEIRTAVLIEEMLRAGKQVAVPRCAGKGIMHAHVIRSLAELRPGTFGGGTCGSAGSIGPYTPALCERESLGGASRLRRRVL